MDIIKEKKKYLIKATAKNTEDLRNKIYKKKYEMKEKKTKEKIKKITF